MSQRLNFLELSEALLELVYRLKFQCKSFHENKEQNRQYSDAFWKASRNRRV